MGTRRKQMRSRKQMRRKRNKYKMDPPRYGQDQPLPYPTSSQIELYFNEIIRLQNRVNMLEELLENSQKSCDKRLQDLQLENDTLGQELAMANLGQPRVNTDLQMDDQEDQAFEEFLAAQDS